MESEMVEALKKEDDIDQTYYKKLVDAAVADISEHGDFEWFVSDDKDNPPWIVPCGNEKYDSCYDCVKNEKNPVCKLGYEIIDFGRGK
jgi:hypothetical protein